MQSVWHRCPSYSTLCYIVVHHTSKCVTSLFSSMQSVWHLCPPYCTPCDIPVHLTAKCVKSLFTLVQSAWRRCSPQCKVRDIAVYLSAICVISLSGWMQSLWPGCPPHCRVCDIAVRLSAKCVILLFTLLDALSQDHCRSIQFKLKKTLIIPQGAILLWSWRARKIIIHKIKRTIQQTQHHHQKSYFDKVI